MKKFITTMDHRGSNDDDVAGEGPVLLELMVQHGTELSGLAHQMAALVGGRRLGKGRRSDQWSVG